MLNLKSTKKSKGMRFALMGLTVLSVPALVATIVTSCAGNNVTEQTEKPNDPNANGNNNGSQQNPTSKIDILNSKSPEERLAFYTDYIKAINGEGTSSWQPTESQMFNSIKTNVEFVEQLITMINDNLSVSWKPSTNEIDQEKLTKLIGILISQKETIAKVDNINNTWTTNAFSFTSAQRPIWHFDTGNFIISLKSGSPENFDVSFEQTADNKVNVNLKHKYSQDGKTSWNLYVKSTDNNLKIDKTIFFKATENFVLPSLLTAGFTDYFNAVEIK